MKRLSFQLLKMLFVVFLISSCSHETTALDYSTFGENKDFVSIDLAQKVAIDFSKEEVFIKPSKEDDSNIHSRSSNTDKLKSSISQINEKEIDELFTINDESVTPALYIINYKPKGFVIISATKKETPILAYSENQTFGIDSFQDEGIKNWIEIRKGRIQIIKNDINYIVPDAINQQWDCIAPPIDDEVTVSGGTIYEQKGPYLLTNWGQGVGYNDYTPSLGCSGNGHAPTGCVATATAQVMRYWGHPSTYNWGIMPNIIYTYTPISSSTLEVADLMRDIGQSINMNYSCASSSAYTSDVRNALVNTFGYSNYATYINFNTNDAVSQLNASWPIIMRGDDLINGGHAWVNDGYKRTKYVTIHNPGTVYEYETYTISDFYFHMNWGWNGSSTGWFLYNDFTPGIFDFTNNNKMIINIHL